MIVRLCPSPRRLAHRDKRWHMLPTPSLKHLSKEDYQRVYEPAEDSFVFLDALEQDADQLRAAAPRVVVEIG